MHRCRPPARIPPASGVLADGFESNLFPATAVDQRVAFGVAPGAGFISETGLVALHLHSTDLAWAATVAVAVWHGWHLCGFAAFLRVDPAVWIY